MTRIAVLEVGGTHASAAWVHPTRWSVEPGGRRRLRGDAAPDELLDAFAACLFGLGPLRGAVLAVAMPGPFDYLHGIGRFRDVGKFEALNGVDVGAGLRARLGGVGRMAFVNDAAAFGLGEWLVGAARGARRAVAITLGTGIGSAFVDAGRLVESGPDVPPDGHVYRLELDGRPLESVVSRRAMLARYQAAGGNPAADVAAIAARAADGDPLARSAFVQPLRLLGAALAPWLARFGAEVLVVGGGMSRSWALVEDALTEGLWSASPPTVVAVRPSTDPDATTAAGAAWHAVGEVEPAEASAETRDERP